MKKALFSRRQIVILATVIVAGALVGYYGLVILLNLLLGGSLF